MKKYLATSFGLLFLTLLFCSNNVSAEEVTLNENVLATAEADVSILPINEDLKISAVISPITEDNVVRNKIELMAYISMSNSKNSLILVGQAIFSKKPEQTIGLGKSECKLTENETKCLVAVWDTNLVENGEYEVSIIDAENIYKIKSIKVTVNNERVIPIEDITAPVITLNGENDITIKVGDSYVDLGATAEDNKDGNITANINISNTVDNSKVGNYTIKYNVSDNAGNKATEVVRNVNVIQKARVISSGSYVGSFTNLNTTPVLEGQILGAEKFIFTLLLKKGMKNNEVMELQKVLINNGLLKISAPTSYFGTLTQKAVKEFQLKNGLKNDGIIGELSRAVLNK